MFIHKILRLSLVFVALLIITGLLLSCTQNSSTLNSVPTSNTTAAVTPTESSITTTSTPTPTKTPVTTPVAATDDLSFLIGDDPANIDNSLLPVTPVEKIHTTGTPVDYDIGTYRLNIEGNVITPLSLTYDDIKALPSVTEVVLLICPGIFADNAEWTGVPITAILDKVGLGDKAFEIIFYDGTQYQKSFFIKDVARDGVFLAYDVDGQPLPREHGFPLRLVVKGEYGNEWVKWIDRIEIK